MAVQDVHDGDVGSWGQGILVGPEAHRVGEIRAELPVELEDTGVFRITLDGQVGLQRRIRDERGFLAKGSRIALSQKGCDQPRGGGTGKDLGSGLEEVGNRHCGSFLSAVQDGCRS